MENTSVIYVKMSLKAPTYILVHYIFVIIIPLSSNIWHRYRSKFGQYYKGLLRLCYANRKLKSHLQSSLD